MNKLYTKRFGAFIIILGLCSSVSYSQFANVDFFRSTPADGVKLLQAYISPWANAFGAGLNGGWYDTAKPHKLLGFDITSGINVGFVPSSAETFNVSSWFIKLLTGSGAAPTIAGPNNSGPLMTYKDKTTGYVLQPSIHLPVQDGNIFRCPLLQIGIGLPLGTELKVRYVPKINIKDGNISLWGVGLMHSLIQYLPGEKFIAF